MVLHNIVQILIVLGSGTSVWFFTHGNIEYGNLAILIGTPAWLYQSISTKAWGVLLLSLWYTYCAGTAYFHINWVNIINRII